VRRLAAALLLLAACSVGDGIDLYDEAGLETATNVEVELIAGGGGVGRWVTVNDTALVAAMAESLDESLATRDAADCAPSYQVRFFRDDGSVVALGYGCRDGRPLLTGPPLPVGEGVTAPDEFVDLVDAEAGLLDDQSGP